MHNILITLVLLVLIGSMLIPIWAASKKEGFNQYAIERSTSYFEDILKSYLVDFKSSGDLVVSKAPDVLDKIKSLIQTLFKEYKIVKSEIVNCFLDIKNYSYIIGSEILLHRQDKMYGILISLKTLHDLELRKFKLIQYNVSSISQDKFMLKSNNIGITMQEYGHDMPIIKNQAYEKTFLQQHYEDIKKYRGITVN
jgi:hypothetical protein